MNINYDIDEDARNIVYMLNDNGIKTIASCDGVESHHDMNDKNNINFLEFYITMEKSGKGINLIAAAYENNMTIHIHSKISFEPWIVYGNTIFSTVLGIRFNNRKAERTKEFANLVYSVITNKYTPKPKSLEYINNLINFIEEDDDNKNMSISFALEINRQDLSGSPSLENFFYFSNKKKSKYNYYKSYKKKLELLNNNFSEYTIPFYNRDAMNKENIQDINMFFSKAGLSVLKFYFNINNLSLALEMAKCLRENSIKTAINNTQKADKK